MKPVNIVTISKITPIYKDGVEASSIQVVNFNFSDGEPCGYDVVTQKNLYEVGDKAVYIQPDYCLSDIKIFESFIRPNGEPNKSRLGKNNRIRAIKFNFSFNPDTNDPIYSFGILMPKSEVDSYLNSDSDREDIDEVLGITKYEEPETGGSGLIKGGLPSFLYTTDEDNINNKKGYVIRAIENGNEFGVTIKRDGSSATYYFRKNNDTFYVGACSRKLEKKMDQTLVSEYVTESGDTYHRYIHPETKIKGWFCDTNSQFFSDDEIVRIDGIRTVEREVKDSWVDLFHSSGLFEKGMEYCKRNDIQLAFRGEIYGQGLKGSGNKNNPDSNAKQGVCFFGIDSLESGFSVRQHYGDEHNLKKVCEELSLEYTKPMVIKPSSYEELTAFCDNIFKEEKANGRLIEGVVIRTMNNNDISVKYMNPEYDSKK